ncbi:MAG: hypothetical protein IPO64_02560 [Bacteroidetes bacterium]|nr:hypothetical protein [Bacteroidota bacterium]
MKCKVVICDLATSALELRLSNSTTMSSTTTVDAVYGGHLYIKVGRFIESTTAYITCSGGTLCMSARHLIIISLKDIVHLAAADSIPIPRLSSAIHPQTQYYLNGGTIELAATGANSFQSLRGNLANPKNYKSVTFSGANTLGVNFKNLTSTVVIDSTLTITGDAIVDCIGGASTTQSFTGHGGLVMSERIQDLDFKTK